MSWERDREQGYETQFARREAASFKAAAHRNRLLAQWAAERMGLRHREAARYADAVVTGDVAHLRGRAIIEKITRDLRAAGITLSDAQVGVTFDRLDAQARAEIAAE